MRSLLTLTIGKTTFDLEYAEAILADGSTGIVCRLTKPNGTVYEVAPTHDSVESCKVGLACSCPAFEHRHRGSGSAGCKHIVHLTRWRLMPAAPVDISHAPGPCPYERVYGKYFERSQEATSHSVTLMRLRPSD
jgi:hypothetical protein